MTNLKTLTILISFLVVSLSGFVAFSQDSTKAPAKAANSQLININSATISQLTDLPGIGPKIAERIVEYRNKNGKFKSKEEIMNVRGIGEKKFARIKDKITI